MRKKIIRSGLLLLFLLMSLAYVIKRPSWVKHEPATSPSVDAAMLEAHVKYLSTQTQRHYQDLAGMDQASRYIKDQFSSMGLQPEEQTFQVNDHSHHNIIVRLGPETGPVTIIGAHYDVFDDLPGADDNASGVAGLIELARLLQQNPPASNIELVAYTLEEPPFFRTEHMGSAVHADALEQEVQLMISLEMIGYFTDEPDTQDYPTVFMEWLYPDQGNFIAVVDQLFSTQAAQLKNSINRYTTIEAFSVNAPTMIPGVDFSDHRSYWAKGIPAVMVTDTAFYRNKNYHTAEDTYDKLDYDKMAQVVLGVFHHIK